MAKTYNTLGTVAPGDVLRANSGTAAYNGVITNVNNYRVPPLCVVYKTASQNIANNTGVILTWDAEYLDTDAMWSSGATMTTSTAGVYLVSASIQWATNTAGIRRLNIQKNISGTTYDTAKRVWEWNAGPMGTVGWAGANYTAFVDAAANDTWALGVVQNTGGALNVNGDATSIEVTFAMYWLGQKS